jgi:streptomycin 6-kinase
MGMKNSMLKINDTLYKTLTENMNSIYGENGQHWVSNLPIIVEELSTLWELSNISPVDNMTFHFVAKAIRQNNQPVVLKVGFDENVISSEMQTLKYFNGQAAIQLIDYNAAHNALLLQQAMPGISLKSLYPLQLDLVMDCYVKTMLKLHQKSLPKIHDFPHIREWLNAIGWKR